MTKFKDVFLTCQKKMLSSLICIKSCKDIIFTKNGVKFNVESHIDRNKKE